MDMIWIVVVVVIVGSFVMKRMGQVSAERVHEMQLENVVVLDVRTAQEFAGGHVEGAVNLPLNELGQRVEAEYSDKNAAILVYCRSGARSGAALGQMKKMGYTQVENLGSLGRAQQILSK